MAHCARDKLGRYRILAPMGESGVDVHHEPGITSLGVKWSPAVSFANSLKRLSTPRHGRIVRKSAPTPIRLRRAHERARAGEFGRVPHTREAATAQA